MAERSEAKDAKRSFALKYVKFLFFFEKSVFWKNHNNDNFYKNLYFFLDWHNDFLNNNLLASNSSLLSLSQTYPRLSSTAEKLWSFNTRNTPGEEEFQRLADFRCKMMSRGIPVAARITDKKRADRMFWYHCQKPFSYNLDVLWFLSKFYFVSMLLKTVF